MRFGSLLLIILNTACSVAIVLVNKIVFDSAGASVSSFVTAAHLIFQFAILGAREAVSPTHAFRRFLHPYSVLSSVAFSICIPIQNLSLHLNTIPANQMGKVLLLPCSVLLNFIFYRDIPLARLVPSLILTVIGSFLFQLSDSATTAAGIAVSIVMVLSSWYSQAAMETCRRELGMTSAQQMLNVLPLSTVFVATTAPFVDSISVSLPAAILQYQPLLNLPSLWFFFLLLSCCLGLVVNWTCFEIVSTMSALSYKMLSHAKTVILFAIGNSPPSTPNPETRFSALMFLFATGIMTNAQPVSARQWVGATITFLGVVWYLAQLEPGNRAQVLSLQPRSSNKKATRLKK
jgi:hypothetical protein